MAKACNSFKQKEEKNVYEISNFFKACQQVNAPVRLEKITLLEDHLPALCSKKDISLYTDTTDKTGLVQQPDKIVVRYALTIYPYSLEGMM